MSDLASFAIVVVFPVPLTPVTRMTWGELSRGSLPAVVAGSSRISSLSLCISERNSFAPAF